MTSPTRWSVLGLAFALGCGPSKLSGTGSETGDEGDPTSIGAETSGDGDGDPSTTSTTDPSDTAEDGETTSNPEVFIPDPDDGQQTTCDMFTQDCPEGEKCVPDFSGWGDFRCVPVQGDKGVGESCSYAGGELGTDDCDGDSHCWRVDRDGVGTCVPFCGGTPEDPGDCGSAPGCDGYDCHVYGQVGIPICEPRCDALAQDCPAGQSCSLDWGGQFVCWIVDQPVAVGDVCEYINQCPAGSLCVDGALLPDCPQGSACCAPVCDLADPDAAAIDCAPLPGSACVDMLDAQDVGCGQVGLCGAPP